MASEEDLVLEEETLLPEALDVWENEEHILFWRRTPIALFWEYVLVLAEEDLLLVPPPPLSSLS